MEDGCVLEEPHVEEAAQAKLGAPQPATDVPTGTRQMARRPAQAHLEDCDFVSLLRQPKGRDTAAKAGADDDKVKIELMVAAPHTKSNVQTAPPLRATGSTVEKVRGDD